MDESDSEYEIEEAVVLVELNGIIDSNFLLQEQNFARILGIETEKPILQIGNYVFSGEFADTLGTVVAYEPLKDGNAKEDFKYLCKTDKKLSMKRVFLQEKDMPVLSEPLKTAAVVNGFSNKEVHSAVVIAENSSPLNPVNNEVIDDSNKDAQPSCNIILNLPAKSVSKSHLNSENIDKDRSIDSKNETCRKRKLDEIDSECIAIGKNIKTEVSSSENTQKQAEVVLSDYNLETVFNPNSEESFVIDVGSQCEVSSSSAETVTTASADMAQRNLISVNDGYSESLNLVQGSIMSAMEMESGKHSSIRTSTMGTEMGQIVESSTDNALPYTLTLNNVLRNDDNCSSSADLQNSKTRVVSDACQSSDNNIVSNLGDRNSINASSQIMQLDENNTVENFQVTNASDISQSSDSKAHFYSDIETVEKNDGNASSSSQINLASDEQGHSVSEIQDSSNVSCEVSQSLESGSQRNYESHTDSNECEVYESETFPKTLIQNALSDSIEIETMDSGSRKLSSCEVTQSNDENETAQCDVFLQRAGSSGLENSLNSENYVDQSDLQDSVRQSLTSEGSASEVSQSHKSVVRYESGCQQDLFDRGICSQSSDQSSDVSVAKRNLCESSSDSSKNLNKASCSEVQESRNIHCEVSQSDRSEKSPLDRFSTSDIECEGSNEHVTESDRQSDVSQSGEGLYSSIADNEELAHKYCEVSQSIFCDANSMARTDDGSCSNECSMYVESGIEINAPEQSSRDDSVSSYGTMGISESIIEVQHQLNDPSCEVSQSFKQENSITNEGVCNYSDTDNNPIINASASLANDEVSQSIKSAGHISILDDDGNNECDRVVEYSEVEKSSPKGENSFTSDVCESSDDINRATASNYDTIRSGQNPACEVSQSCRSRNVNSDGTEEYIGIEVETSNECDVIEIEVYQDMHQENKNNEAVVVSQVSQSSFVQESPVAQSGFNEPICGSSEDIKKTTSIVIKSDSDASSSSDKLSKTVTRDCVQSSRTINDSSIAELVGTDSPTKNDSCDIVESSSSRSVLTITKEPLGNVSESNRDVIEDFRKPSTSQLDVSTQQNRRKKDNSSIQIEDSESDRQTSTDARPSLLEVMVSSASDFRNSLINENKFNTEVSQVSSVGQSYNLPDNEYSDAFLNEAVGYPCEGTSKNSIPLEEVHSPSVGEGHESLISGSLETISVLDVSVPSNVSQSSDVVNTHSSSEIQAITSQSSLQDLVQSSSNISRSSSENAALEEHVSSVHENTEDGLGVSESFNSQFIVPTSSRDNSTSTDSSNLMQSPEDQIYPENISTHCLDNIEGEVSSTPSDTHFEVLAIDDNVQSLLIEGNIILSGVNIGSGSSYANIVSEAPFNTRVESYIDGTNEAETLNSVSEPPSPPPSKLISSQEHLPVSSDDVAPAFEIDVESDDSFPSDTYVVVDEIYDSQEVPSLTSPSHVSGSDQVSNNSAEAEPRFPEVDDLIYDRIADDCNLTSSMNNDVIIGEASTGDSLHPNHYSNEESSGLEIWEAQNSNLVDDSSDEQSDRMRSEESTDSPEVESSTKSS